MIERIVGEGIVKTYSKNDVLKNVSITLEKGKIYGLIGRNGAGKTTLLSILSAQNPATKGTILCNGMPVWENQEALDHICFSREINSGGNAGTNGNSMKIKDYLYAASLYYPNWDKEMADKLVQEFELDVKKNMVKVSKGMLSMVTIIIALASKADYTFLDEPVAGLDVVMREYFYKVLLDEYMNTGRTFVISTHIIEEAADVFEEVIIVNKGEILLKEETQQLLDRAYHISGREEEVDSFMAGKKVYHVEKSGRSKAAMILANAGELIRGNENVDVQPMSLQQVFVALCGKEA